MSAFAPLLSGVADVDHALIRGVSIYEVHASPEAAGLSRTPKEKGYSNSLR
jgi:hypothetical protein